MAWVQSHMPALLASDRADAFPRVFDNFAVGRNRLSRVNSAAVDARLANFHAMNHCRVHFRIKGDCFR